MANYTLNHTGAQVDTTVETVVSNSATNGQVLTANGNGGVEWNTPSNHATFSLNGTVLTITEE